MPEFESWHAYSDFAGSVRTQLRYVRDSPADRFLETVLATCAGRVTKVEKGRKFWRAQLGGSLRESAVDDDEGAFEIMEDCPHPPSRMKPIPNWSAEGRANPRGIPYLYLATQKDTAIAETRPWVGSLVSVGIFEVKRELSIVDCSRNHQDFHFYFEEPPPPERERAVWSGIDAAFAKPVERGDDISDYIPTQIIAELFKRNGYDGIAYKSAFGEDGYNVALFDVEAADLTYCELHKVNAIKFSFEQYANPYWIEKRA